MLARKYDYPLIVIGAGAAGLVIAVGAAKAGKRVLLIEKGSYGGDCTNFGCIPSKATISAAAVAHKIKESAKFGIEKGESPFKTAAALEKTREIVESIRSSEEPHALEKLGIDTLTGKAAFKNRHTLEVRGEDRAQVVRGKNIVIATGSQPKIPAIEGIGSIAYLTNETIFDLQEVPEHLAIIGGGPVGCELAQAFCRLGSQVTIIQKGERLLMRETEEASALIKKIFEKEGVAVKLKSAAASLKKNGSGVTVTLENGEEINASHLLIAAGREAAITALNLDAAGVTHNKRGIAVDAYGRTRRKNIWAVGDVAGRAFFTHLAENEARAVLTSLLFSPYFKKRLDREQSIPRVTYCSPEVASFGITESEAKERYGANFIASYRVPLTAVDRAIVAREEEGFVHVVTKKWSSKILGATIIAPRAGEMIMELAAAKYFGIPLRHLSRLIHPYPTFSMAIRKAADLWLIETILPLLKRRS